MKILGILLKKIDNFKKQVSPIKYARNKGVIVGDKCEFHENIFWGSEPFLIEIGNQVRITNNVRFITHDGGVWVLRNNGKLPNADKFGKIKIGNNVHIGMNSTIMPGVNIGNNVIIGCDTVVTKDIPDNSVAVGTPARVIESIDEYYEKIKNKCDFTKDYNYNKKKNYLINKYCKR